MFFNFRSKKMGEEIPPQDENLVDLISNVAPVAYAEVKGGATYPLIDGVVGFYNVQNGVLVVADIKNLPTSTETCAENIFGFHIHEGESCDGTPEEPFKESGEHYNPNNCPHPAHSGDLPPLFGANGRAFMAVLINRFDLADIVGKTVVIHSNRDDFTTQPAGNSGEKIACGVIRLNRR